MKKTIGFFAKFIELIIRFVYFVMAAIVIVIAMYALGGFNLTRGSWGSDMGSAVSIAVWVNRYYPNIPFWYPLAGGGISVINAYPSFSFYLASFLRSISTLNIIQSFTFLGFISVLSMAFSIYAFVALRFKNQTAAFLSSIFYLVSPIAWTWLVDWGFYAESVSHIFVGPTILFWDLFFVNFINKNWGLRTRLYLFFTICFLSLAMVTHFLEGFALIRFFSFYILGYTILSHKKRKEVLLLGVSTILLVIVFSYLITFPITNLYNHYTQIASNSGLTSNTSFEQINESLPSPLNVLGFQKISASDNIWSLRNFTFPAFVSLLAIVGFLLFSWRDKRILTFGMYSLVGFTLSISSYYLYYLRDIPILSSLIMPGTSMREMFIIIRMVWPILAALAIINIVELPFYRVKNYFFGNIKRIAVVLVALFVGVFILYVSIDDQLVGGYYLYAAKRGEKLNQTPRMYNYGARGKFDFRNIFGVEEGQIRLKQDICTSSIFSKDQQGIEQETYKSAKVWCESSLNNYFVSYPISEECNFKKRENKEPLSEICFPEKLTLEKVENLWNKCKNGDSSFYCQYRIQSLEEQLGLNNIPKFSLMDKYGPNQTLDTILASMEAINSTARVDFSPYLGNLSMNTPYYNVNRSLSQLHYYIPSASLLLRFQGWQQMVYYLNAPQFSNPNLINELARWFGINYVFLSGQTKSSLFEKSGWEYFAPKGVNLAGNTIFAFPEQNPLVELSNKTTILAIGKNKLQVYDQVFDVGAFGALPYKDMYLIRGKEAIDDYNLEELKHFDVVLLHGYTYKNKGRANLLLKQYVEEGGGVFIDTGWQYMVPDWQSKDNGDNLLDIIPFNTLSWRSLGKTSNFSFDDNQFSSNVDLKKFNPLIYGDQSWSVSTSEKNNLKTWAKVILSAEGYPLIATGDLGKGKIIWSGMNIFAHAYSGKRVYQEEIQMLHNLFAEFNEKKEIKNYAISFIRNNPDVVEFKLEEDITNGGYLLWKEAYYPDFKTRLVNKNSGQETSLSVYPAGPGFTLIRVPHASSGDMIIRSYQKPFLVLISPGISVVGVIFLILFILDAFAKDKSLLRLTFIYFNKKAGTIKSVIKIRRKTFFESKDEEDY